MAPSAHVIDVGTADFPREVLERSRDVPVVVDFWAEWCAPCRTLGPILEASVDARDGDVVLAKVDVDDNQELAARFGIRGIPAVKGFRDGEVVDGFTGALPRQQVEAFLDRLVPSEADRLAAEGVRLITEGDRDGGRQRFESALEEQADHRVAAIELARIIHEDEPDRALELLAPHRPDPAAEQVVAQAELAREGSTDLRELRAAVEDAPEDAAARVRLGRALAAHGAYEDAIDELLTAVRAADGHSEEAREQILAIFRVLGEDHPLVTEARRRLASALF